MTENFCSGGSIALGVPTAFGQSRQGGRVYLWGGEPCPLDDSALTKARILHTIKNTNSALRLHMLKDKPFVADPDRSFDWFLGFVQLVNDKVRAEPRLLWGHLFDPVGQAGRFCKLTHHWKKLPEDSVLLMQ